MITGIEASNYGLSNISNAIFHHREQLSISINKQRKMQLIPKIVIPSEYHVSVQHNHFSGEKKEKKNKEEKKRGKRKKKEKLEEEEGRCMTDCARVVLCRVVSVSVRSGSFSQSVSGRVVSVSQCQVG